MRILGIVVFVCMFILGTPLNVMAEDIESCEIPVDYSNHLYNYTPETFGRCRTSFIGKLADGGYQTVIYYDGKLYINTYDSGYHIKTAKELKLELPI